MTQLEPSELRPFGAGEAIDVAANVFRAHFWRFYGRAALVVVPLTALRWAHQMGDLHPTARALVAIEAGRSTAADFLAASRFMTLGVMERHAFWAISAAITTIIFGAVWCTRPALAAMVGNARIQPRRLEIGRLATGVFRIACIALLLGPLTFTLVAAAIGLFLLGRWGLHPGIAVGEGPTGSVAPRARALASGSEMRIGWRITLGALLGLLFASSLSLAGMGLFSAGALNVPESLVTVSMVLAALSVSFISAFVGCLLATVYLEQRTRTEGFDIALMIQDMATRAELQ